MDSPEATVGNIEKLESLLHREHQVADQIVAKGQSLLMTWTHVDAAVGRPGMQYINPTNRKIYQQTSEAILIPDYWQPLELGFIDFDNPLNKDLRTNRVYEKVVVVPITERAENVKQVQETVWRKGFLNRRKQVKTTVNESYTTNGKPLSVKEVLGAEADSDEPAVGIYYLTTNWGAYDIVPDEAQYRDLHGRPGNFLALTVIVPYSLAQTFSELVQEDPTFARKILISLVSQKYPERFRQEVWRDYGRPPYAKWEKYHGSAKLYFADLIAHPEDKKEGRTLDLDFNPNRIIEFHTRSVNKEFLGVPEQSNPKTQ